MKTSHVRVRIKVWRTTKIIGNARHKSVAIMIEKLVNFKRDYLEISFLRENCGYDGSDDRRRHDSSRGVATGGGGGRGHVPPQIFGALQVPPTQIHAYIYFNLLISRVLILCVIMYFQICFKIIIFDCFYVFVNGCSYPPPPPRLTLDKSDDFFFACQLVPQENEDFFRWGLFFGEGGGGGLVSSKC